jgi:hypothetical protein
LDDRLMIAVAEMAAEFSQPQPPPGNPAIDIERGNGVKTCSAGAF